MWWTATHRWEAGAKNLTQLDLRWIGRFAAICALIFAATGFEPAVAQPLAETMSTCVKGGTNERSVAACTSVLQDRSLSRDDRAYVLAVRGLHLVRLGQYERGIEDLDEALRLKPNMPNSLLPAIYAMRGLARHKLGMDELALEDMNRALQLDPNFALLYPIRAIVYINRGELDRAISDCDKGLRLDPGSIDALITRALALRMKGDFDRALVDLNEAIRLDPNRGLAYAGRGLTYLKKENYDQAIADLTRAMSLGMHKLDDLRVALRDAREAKAALQLRVPPPKGAKRPELSKRIALVIGNGEYQHIGRLPNAENDAADVGTALAGMGYRVFGHPKSNFTRAEMEAEIDAFQRAAIEADTALIWYAGHGQEFREQNEDGRNWLIPIDARIDKPSDVYKAGVSMSRLLNAAVPARHLRLVVIDACRNNNLPSARRSIGPRLAVEQRSGMMIVFSTRAGTVALDGEGRNSPFAAAFLDAVRDKSRLDVRQFFGAVVRGTLERTRNAQEPELLVRLQTDVALPLEP